ncbi:unnamed protein product [Rodentolepis nana]|uniref:NFRKB_winged domain-containing protein n=1 Tax=Rodentolepis nana TaxID=102285 RepID=A0A0R3TQ63_RODNA|nr:unnamed protein product [Rodentolepis nana]
MVEGAEATPVISTDSENIPCSSLFHLLYKDREDLLCQLRHRILRLKEIVDEKLKRKIPITPREDDCLRRYSHVLKDEDNLKSNANDRMNKILSAVESHDAISLESIPLFPRNEDLPIIANEEINVETLISDYIQRSQREFTKEDFKNLRIADIIAAVDNENGNSKANKKNKRKASRPKVAANQARNAPPPSKKRKLNDELCNFPPELMQYVRGFFNALRLIMTNMADSEDGISAEQLCEIVRVWSSDHRVRRINSQWISRCEDWSEFVRPALSLLAGKNSTLVLASPPNFVRFNSTTHSWSWLGYRSTLCPEDPVEAAESETATLARLFSLWARRNDLSGGSCKQLPKPSSRNEVEHEEDEVDHFSDNVEEQEAPSAATKSRRRQVKPEQVPPPYYTTDWQCALSTPEQRRQFQEQEEKRFSTPWAPFVYNQHGYASVVAPVFRDGSGNKMRATLSARDHPLLRNDRPPWVSISEIVRDAVARLPNGEGTRPEIAMLVQDSGYLVSPFNFKQLNQCISSALDRLQSEGEKSPVMYDSAQRLWIYRFRHLSANDFFRMYKEQSDYQHKRFQQVYPRGRVAYGVSTGQRSSSAFRGSLGIPRVASRRLSTSMHIMEMNEEEEEEADSIPDIEDLNQEESDESMSGNDNDDGESYSGSEVDTSHEMPMQQYEHHNQRRKYDAFHSRRSQHFQFPSNMY